MSSFQVIQIIIWSGIEIELATRIIEKIQRNNSIVSILYSWKVKAKINTEVKR